MHKTCTYNNIMNKENATKAARAIIGLLILLIAFTVLLIFNLYRENIILGNNFPYFVILTLMEMCFLVILLFLINPHHNLKPKLSKNPSRKRKK